MNASPAATAQQASRSAGPGWGQYVAWVFIGPVLAAGLLAAFTPLILITGPVSAGLASIVIARRGLNASAFGALSGIGAGPIVVAALNWPEAWIGIVVGGALIAAGLIGYCAVAPRSGIQATRDGHCP